ncbi:hypothetical protein CRYO30217_03260 [Parvicella tangerina]|uniref:Uncharacterized protein n=1 Tax=Parvicella tangerina TaxID=2829795 RepID=A0A916JS89_9FLAO|nr:hypothetical protein CRYO30217_03260 [Parvicella tangerina]
MKYDFFLPKLNGIDNFYIFALPKRDLKNLLQRQVTRTVV